MFACMMISYAEDTLMEDQIGIGATSDSSAVSTP